MKRKAQRPSEVCGGCSSSKVVDAQAAYERVLTLTPVVLAGPDFVVGMGKLEDEKTMALELLVKGGRKGRCNDDRGKS